MVLSDGEDRYSTRDGGRRARSRAAVRRADLSDCHRQEARRRSSPSSRPSAAAGRSTCAIRRSCSADAQDDRRRPAVAVPHRLRAVATRGRPRTREWRSITVKVNRPDLRVRARSGYSTDDVQIVGSFECFLLSPSASVRMRNVGRSIELAHAASARSSKRRRRSRRPARRAECHLIDRPVEVNFSFEQSQSRVGVDCVGRVAHRRSAIIAFLDDAATRPSAIILDILPEVQAKDIVWLSEPGPGRRRRRRRQQEPGSAEEGRAARQGQGHRPGQARARSQRPTKRQNRRRSRSSTFRRRRWPRPSSRSPGRSKRRRCRKPTSQGAGTGGGGGTGTGTGIGSGQGSGLGPGFGGGTGGGAYRPGNGVTLPRVLREVKPQYTADAMRAKVQGTVWLECVVLPDGRSATSRSPSRSTRSSASIRKRSRPRGSGSSCPARDRASRCPVLITIELTFTLR